MRRNSINKKIAAAVAALSVMMAVSPVTAQAAGLKVYQTSGNISYIALKNCNQNMIIRRLKMLGINDNCLKWVEDIFNGACPEVPEIPSEPETPVIPAEPETPAEPEIPTTPAEPELPTVPAEPETPTVPSQPEIPTVPVEPEVPTTPSQPETPTEPETPTIPAQPETPTTPSKPESSFAEQVITLVNQERAKEGLSPLAYDASIEKAALIRAKEIQTSFSHTRPNGSSFSTVFKEAGVTYRRVGENIAWGQKTPEEVVRVWMNSPSHRANIMNANYGRIGVGHLTNSRGVSYWVQLFAN